jgi:sensor histidine kinase YesM
MALRLALPPIMGVVIYIVIRIIADSNNHGFIDWTRPLWLFGLECAWTIFNVAITHEAIIYFRVWLFKRVFKGGSEQPHISQSAYLLREIQWVFLSAFLVGSAFGLPFTALTDDGLSFFDFFVNSLVTIVFISAYLLATRGRDYVRLLNQSELELERYKHDVTTARLQALRNQVNPHFLFNALNTLSSLVHRDADAADEFIQQLAKVYRYLLEHAEQDLVPLCTELAFVESYIFLLKTRFQEALHVNISIDEALEVYMLPPMTLQMLIENAVKHNIVSPTKPLTIEISSDSQGCVIVKNTLQERSEKDASSSVGLANVASRYEFLQNRTDGKKPSVSVSSSEFIVTIPLLE